jgi:RNA polymerase sigma factor (sigma-70 family)
MERDLEELLQDTPVTLAVDQSILQHEADDGELLQAFVRQGESQAFRHIVDRYSPIVYAAARRQVRDAHLSEDVTQAVFILLARKAKSISGDRLAGWLVNTTRLASKATVRAEARRKRRERHAMNVNPRAEHSMPSTEPMFEESADAALCRLGDADRTAVTLRYLRGMTQREVAATMGVSEDAAAQRLSRALAKLRKFFTRSGGGAALSISSPFAVGEQLQLLTQNAAHLPAGLTNATAEAGLRGMHAVLPAAEIARAVWSTWRWQIGIKVVSTVTAMLLVLGSVLFASRGGDTGITGASTDTGPLGPIRVGVYISATTAVPAPPERNAWYQQFRVMEELRDVADLTLIPIIEPGYDQQPQQKRLLRYYFADTPLIYATDTAAMQKLDVIVASAAHEIPVAALQSIEAAVREGTGLYIRGCLGGCSPGMTHTSAVAIRGFTAGVTAQNPSPQECLVVASHPVLGSLSSQVGASFAISPAGSWGPLQAGGVSLLRLKSRNALMTKDGKPLPNGTPMAGDMLYVSTLGKGRIVGFNFAGATPEPLQHATGSRFVGRVVQWAAHRPVE